MENFISLRPDLKTNKQKKPSRNNGICTEVIYKVLFKRHGISSSKYVVSQTVYYKEGENPQTPN